jgi:hypothetical protein
MNGVVVKMVGSKLVVEIDILRAIAEGVSGGRPISSVKPGSRRQTWDRFIHRRPASKCCLATVRR